MIFDVEKWERIKNGCEDAHHIYRLASDDFRFEKSQFEKSAGYFQENFPATNTLLIKIHEAIKQLRRMNPLEMSVIELNIEKTLALTETGTTLHQHLKQLSAQLITMKRAEARKESAEEILRNNNQCFNVLETFARNHIKLRTSSGPAIVKDNPTAMEFYTGSL